MRRLRRRVPLTPPPQTDVASKLRIVTRDIFIWWLTAQAFGLAGLPLTRFLFRALPDRGFVRQEEADLDRFLSNRFGKHYA